MFNVGTSASATPAGSMPASAAPAPSPAEFLRNLRREKPYLSIPVFVMFEPSCLLRLSHCRVSMALERAHQSAIDDKKLAGHVPAVFRCQEDDRARYVFRIAGAAQRYLALGHV